MQKPPALTLWPGSRNRPIRETGVPMCVNVHTLPADCGEWDEVEQVADVPESRLELKDLYAVFFLIGQRSFIMETDTSANKTGDAQRAAENMAQHAGSA